MRKLNTLAQVCVLAITPFPAAYALDIKLPDETALYKPSDLPGFQRAQQKCLICHSADYAQYQPPSSPRAYWLATVKKMQKPFGAPLDDTDIDQITDYLVKTYGNEQAKK